MKRRILAFVLAFVMVITNSPVSAFAGEAEDTTISTVSEGVLDLNEINESTGDGVDKLFSEESILDKMVFEEAKEQANIESENASDLGEINDSIEDGTDTLSLEEFVPSEENFEKSEEQINRDEAKNIVEASEDSPAFEQKKNIDGVTITVTADEGIIPQGASIEVTKITKASVKNVIIGAIEETKENEGIEDISDDSVQYYYDVCLLDRDGNEIQPENGGSINITFSLNISDSPIVGANVYHIENINVDEGVEVDNGETEEQILEATILDQVVDDISGEKDSESDDEPVYEITVSSDGFSYYVVEFFFSNYKYTLNGNSEVLLQDILDELNIEGNVEEAVSSAPEYLFVEKDENNNWIVKALAAFDSEEKLNLLMEDGAEVVIIVHDSQASSIIYWGINNGLLKISTVEQSGTYCGSINQAHYDYMDPRSPLDIPWYSHRADISKVEVGGDEDIVRPLSMAFWFYELGMSNRNLSKIEFKGIDTSYVKSMQCTFLDCTIDSLDLSGFNTSNVTDMSGMFYGCYAKKLDLSSFNTARVTNMAGMFQNISSQELDLSNFNTEKVTDMSDMFAGATSLRTLDISNFNTSNVIDMSNMFIYTYSLTVLKKGDDAIFESGIIPTPNTTGSIFFTGNWYDGEKELTSDEVGSGVGGTYISVNPKAHLYWSLDESGLLTISNEEIDALFEGDFYSISYTYGIGMPWLDYCEDIQSVIVGSENDKVSPLSMEYWFLRCSNLETIDFHGLDTSYTVDMSYLFSGCKV